MASYSELIQLPTWEERLEYLMLHAKVFDETFGGRRWLNQQFYSSEEWRRFRRQVLIRDNGCDLAVPGNEILGKRNMYVHHIVPITPDMLSEHDPRALDLENAVLVTRATHQLIHYGDMQTVKTEPTVRKPFDTCPWR